MVSLCFSFVGFLFGLKIVLFDLVSAFAAYVMHPPFSAAFVAVIGKLHRVAAVGTLDLISVVVVFGRVDSRVANHCPG